MSSRAENTNSNRTAAIKTRNPNYSDSHRLLSLPDLAERWQVSVKTVRRLVARGELPVHRIGGQLRVSPDAARAYEKLRSC